MSKKINITDKLSFDTNPVIKIKEQEIEIQSGAENMLKIMGLFGSGNDRTEVQASIEAANLLFAEADKEKIRKLNLQMKDYMLVIEEAMNAAMETNGEELGEQ